MKTRRVFLLAVFALAAACANAAAPGAAPARPNILLLCVDDLRPELRSFGAAYIHSPAMDSLAASGRAFTRHYVQAPTCGASRSALLTGQYASAPELRGNDALLLRAARPDTAPPTLPRHFRENGYRTVAIGKISHHPGGLGGKDWADPAKVEMPGAWDANLMPSGPWQTPQRAMHGYTGGRPRVPGKTPAFEHTDESDELAYPDGWITREALAQMETLAAAQSPFFLAVGIIKPHLPFVTPRAYLDLYAGVELPPIPHPQRPAGLSTWHESKEFFSSYAHDGRDPRTDAAYADQIRRSYAASVSYADAQVARILEKLDALGLAQNTLVVLWGDHGWHLGEHAIWGKHALFEESLRAPLVIRAP
ncbi:MAG: sulfatase-like hydrolase/transferase, partial [Opitutaceae bacterium]|nr:sulfatase-like hydrolase/transferase [Opitutaceae bacterium]